MNGILIIPFHRWGNWVVKSPTICSIGPSREVAIQIQAQSLSSDCLHISQALSSSRSTLLYPAIITLWISTSLTFFMGSPKMEQKLSANPVGARETNKKWGSSTTHGDGGTRGAWNPQQWLGKERRNTWNCQSHSPHPHTSIMPPEEEENILYYTDLLSLGNTL